MHISNIRRFSEELFWSDKIEWKLFRNWILSKRNWELVGQNWEPSSVFLQNNGVWDNDTKNMYIKCTLIWYRFHAFLTRSKKLRAKIKIDWNHIKTYVYIYEIIIIYFFWKNLSLFLKKSIFEMTFFFLNMIVVFY